MNSLQEFVQKKEHIYCFGIGVYGKKLTRLLNKMSIEINAYIVSSKQNKQAESYRGVPVFSVDELQITASDGVLLATISADFKDEMERAIEEKTSCGQLYWFMDYKDICDLLRKEMERKRNKVIRRRARLSLFDYLSLANNMEPTIVDKDFARKRVLSSNMAYGHEKCIKRYLNMPRYDTRKCTILHAVWMDTMYTEGEMNPPDGNFFTMSDEMLRDYRRLAVNVKSVYSIGPYILYAKPMLSHGQLQHLKRKLGKTLLVIPQHTTNDVEFSYDQNIFLKEIEAVRIKHNFDTVLVCLYFIDVQKKKYNMYKKMGYRVVCAGHSQDSNFIRRLRTFIELADVSMGNTVMGTFIGYSIALNTPHYLFENHSTEISDYDIYEKAGYKSLGGKELDLMLHNDITVAFEHAFSTYDERITREQIALVEKYWGKWNHRTQHRKI